MEENVEDNLNNEHIERTCLDLSQQLEFSTFRRRFSRSKEHCEALAEASKMHACFLSHFFFAPGGFTVDHQYDIDEPEHEQGSRRGDAWTPGSEDYMILSRRY